MHSRARVPRQPSPKPVMLLPDRIGATAHLLVFVAAFLLLASRRPDAVLHAQFWAEDGTVFYANAYNAGWRSLLMAYGGYLNLVSQIVGLLALLVPLRLAPLLMNFCA